MKHSRKKRTPQLDLEKLREVAAQIRSEGELGKLASYFALLETLRLEGALTTPFIALQALARLTEASTEGYEEEDILKSCPEAWGHETISVPAPLLTALKEAWDKYQLAGAGVSLGESFGIEGKGKGKMKAKLKQRLKENRIMNAVELEYIAADNMGKKDDALTLEQAREQVAENVNLSLETVKAYHKKHQKQSRTGATSMGVLKG